MRPGGDPEVLGIIPNFHGVIPAVATIQQSLFPPMTRAQDLPPTPSDLRRIITSGEHLNRHPHLGLSLFEDGQLLWHFGSPGTRWGGSFDLHQWFTRQISMVHGSDING